MIDCFKIENFRLMRALKIKNFYARAQSGVEGIKFKLRNVFWIWILSFFVANLQFTVSLPSCKTKPGEKGFQQPEKDSIVELHNKFRKQVKDGEIKGLPKAKEMLEMTWDKTLEDEAQRWADLCPSISSGQSHPPNDWKKFPYGQNVAWGHQSILDAIHDWIDEFKPYIAKGVDPLIFRNPDDKERVQHGLGDIGHFTAIVTAKSNKLGCGRVKDNSLEYKVIYVCNYSPPGNIIFTGRDGKANPIPAYETSDAAAKDESKKATETKKNNKEREKKKEIKEDLKEQEKPKIKHGREGKEVEDYKVEKEQKREKEDREEEEDEDVEDDKEEKDEKRGKEEEKGISSEEPTTRKSPETHRAGKRKDSGKEKFRDSSSNHQRFTGNLLPPLNPKPNERQESKASINTVQKQSNLLPESKPSTITVQKQSNLLPESKPSTNTVQKQSNLLPESKPSTNTVQKQSNLLPELKPSTNTVQKQSNLLPESKPSTNTVQKQSNLLPELKPSTNTKQKPVKIAEPMSDELLPDIDRRNPSQSFYPKANEGARGEMYTKNEGKQTLIYQPSKAGRSEEEILKPLDMSKVNSNFFESNRDVFELFKKFGEEVPKFYAFNYGAQGNYLKPTYKPLGLGLSYSNQHRNAKQNYRMEETPTKSPSKHVTFRWLKHKNYQVNEYNNDVEITTKKALKKIRPISNTGLKDGPTHVITFYSDENLNVNREGAAKTDSTLKYWQLTGSKAASDNTDIQDSNGITLYLGNDAESPKIENNKKKNHQRQTLNANSKLSKKDGSMKQNGFAPESRINIDYDSPQNTLILEDFGPTKSSQKQTSRTTKFSKETFAKRSEFHQDKQRKNSQSKKKYRPRFLNKGSDESESSSSGDDESPSQPNRRRVPSKSKFGFRGLQVERTSIENSLRPFEAYRTFDYAIKSDSKSQEDEPEQRSPIKLANNLENPFTLRIPMSVRMARIKNKLRRKQISKL